MVESGSGRGRSFYPPPKSRRLAAPAAVPAPSASRWSRLGKVQGQERMGMVDVWKIDVFFLNGF